jgi:hypothetical protein
VVPSDNSDLNAYNNLLNLLGCGIYSGLNNTEESVVSINTQIDLLNNIFVKQTENMDLPKVKKHFTIASSISNNEEPILVLKNGESLFSRFKVKNGNCYVSAVPFESSYSDLQVKSIFVPLVLKMALSGFKSAELAYQIGNNIAIPIYNNNSSSEPNVVLKSEFQEFMPLLISIENLSYLKINGLIKKSGIFTLKGYKNEFEPKFAFNYNRAESDLNFYSESELEKKLSLHNIGLINITNKNLTTIVKEINTGVVLWKWFLLLALFFVIAEICILRFWKV